jgi:hypothetical protein
MTHIGILRLRSRSFSRDFILGSTLIRLPLWSRRLCLSRTHVYPDLHIFRRFPSSRFPSSFVSFLFFVLIPANSHQSSPAAVRTRQRPSGPSRAYQHPLEPASGYQPARAIPRPVRAWRIASAGQSPSTATRAHQSPPEPTRARQPATALPARHSLVGPAILPRTRQSPSVRQRPSEVGRGHEGPTRVL